MSLEAARPDDKLALAVPKFSGSPTESSTTFMRQCDEVKGLRAFDDTQMILAFRAVLTGQAADWFDAQRESAENAFPTWAAVKLAFFKRYRPRLNLVQEEAALKACKQRQKEPTRAFHDRCILAHRDLLAASPAPIPNEESKAEQTARLKYERVARNDRVHRTFVAGVRPNILNIIEAKCPSGASISDLLDEIEKQERTSDVNPSAKSTSTLACVDVAAIDAPLSLEQRMVRFEKLLAAMTTAARPTPSATNATSRSAKGAKGAAKYVHPGKQKPKGKSNFRQRPKKDATPQNTSAAGWRCYRCHQLQLTVPRDTVAAADFSMSSDDIAWVWCCGLPEDQSDAAASEN